MIDPMKRLSSIDTASSFSCLPAVLIFIAVSSFRIGNPGLYYDEMLFVNGAIKISDVLSSSLPLADKLDELPLMVFPYVGALKSWLFHPIFQWYGFSPLTIRFPSILLSAGTIYISYLTARKWLGPLYGPAVAFLLAASPALVFQSKLDWGPVVIMLFCKALVIYYFALLTESGRLKHLVCIIAVMAVGTYDKFNFIWIVVSFFLSSLIVFNSTYMRLLKNAPKSAIFAVAAACLTMLGIFLYKVMPLVSMPEWKDLYARWNYVAHLYAQTMSQGGIGFTMKNPPVLHNAYGHLLIVSLALFISACAGALRERRLASFMAQKNTKIYIFFVLLFFVTFIQVVFTPAATGPHHAMALMPFDLFAFIAALSLFGDARSIKWQRSFTCLFLLVVSASVCFGLKGVIRYDMEFAKDSGYSNAWSPMIYRLAAHVDFHSGSVDRIAFTDWGISHQVSALVDKGVRAKIADLWIPLKGYNKESDTTNYAEQFLPSGPTLCILFASPVFKETKEHFLQIISERPGLEKRIETINDESGPLYELYFLNSRG